MARVQKAAGAAAAPAKAKGQPAAAPVAGDTAKKATAKKAPAAAKAPETRKSAPARSTTPAKSPAASRPAPTAKAPARGATRSGHKVPADKFLAEQQALLLEERSSHMRQAEALKEEADALAAEMEPGESEFGEEGGEGGNLSVERELDLVLSAQAKMAVEEIDRALAKIDAGTYGVCEKCGKEIPKARLKVLPHAPLCVACKSGGLSRR